MLSNYGHLLKSFQQGVSLFLGGGMFLPRTIMTDRTFHLELTAVRGGPLSAASALQSAMFFPHQDEASCHVQPRILRRHVCGPRWI